MVEYKKQEKNEKQVQTDNTFHHKSFSHSLFWFFKLRLWIKFKNKQFIGKRPILLKVVKKKTT